MMVHRVRDLHQLIAEQFCLILGRKAQVSMNGITSRVNDPLVTPEMLSC